MNIEQWKEGQIESSPLTRNRRTLIALALLLAAASAVCAGGMHERLNGTWVSRLMTVNIDFDGGTYEGVALGKEFNRRLALVREYANVVIFTIDGARVTAQFQKGGGVILTKEGGVPVEFERAAE
jgi:hypothetical protein